MVDKDSDAVRMMRLFEGFQGAHGTHGEIAGPNQSKAGKQEIKATARTVREPVTIELWEQHLSGRRALGVIPIREDGMCLWGCIDVDQYDVSHADIVRQLHQRKIPLVLCRSKSGGAHAFLFLSEPAPAIELRSTLRQLSASMGWGDSEIFPKQNEILADKGDLGNWLNMPYLDAENTKRYGVKETGAGMELSEFLSYAEKRRVHLDEVEQPGAPQDETLNDGPPCLQHLAEVGFPEGTRNNGLFGLGIFCKKKFGTRWREMLDQYNQQYMDPPLPATEVTAVINSLEKKDYLYKCKDQPCVSYCNSTLCKTRKFGIGGAGKYPSITGISKLGDGEDTLWFATVEDQRIELTTTQLQNYREFQRICMDQLTVMYLPMRADTWASMVGEAMANATILDVAPEATTKGAFMELLHDFLTNKYRGTKMDDLLNGKPWLNESDNRHYFRLKDLCEHLANKGFKSWGRNVIGRRVEEIGGRHFFQIKGHGTNVYWVEDDIVESPDISLPKLEDRPL